MAVITNLGENQAWPIGADFVFEVLTTTDGESGGTPTTNTGRALTFVLEAVGGDGTNLVNLTTGGGAITFSNSAGTNDLVSIASAAADTASLSEGEYNWALWRTGSGTKYPYAAGRVRLALVASP